MVFTGCITFKTKICTNKMYKQQESRKNVQTKNDLNHQKLYTR